MNGKTLKIGRPEMVGMTHEGLESAFRVLSREVEKGGVPGAVAAVGRHGTIVGFRSYGWAEAFTEKRLMQMDTLFDLASVTKVTATLPSVLQQIDAGLIRLDDNIQVFLPEWQVPGAEKVRLRHLLNHTAGFPAHRRFWLDGLKADEIRRAVLETPLEREPGVKVLYSDLSFMFLQFILERVATTDIWSYSKKNIFDPLGMKDTMYVPGPALRGRAAATEYNKETDSFIVGQVHDENARFMGGIAGHAGLFSTVQDLCVYCQMILNGGTYGGARILSPAVVRASTKLTTPPGEEARGLGWLKKGPEYSACGDLLSDEVIFHTGFTGTAIFIDRTLDLFIVLLTNRVHPTRENEAIRRIRPRFCNAVAASVEDWG